MIQLVNAEAGVIPLPDGVVHCSATSPPYWSLRQYQGDQARDWPAVTYSPMPGLPPLTIPPMTCALGHEPTPEAFIGHLVHCYREVWRVSRDDSVHWCVIGDSYAADRGYQVTDSKWRDVGNNHGSKVPNGLKGGDLVQIPHRLALALQGDGWIVRNDVVWQKKSPMPESVQATRWERHRIKVRNLRGQKTQSFASGSGRSDGDNPGGGIDQLPWAEYAPCPGCPACQATGGYVLRRGSWRHTRAHETVLMLVKSMGYWCDQEAVREANNINPNWNYGSERYRRDITQDAYKIDGDNRRRKPYPKGWSGLAPAGPDGAGRNPRSVRSYDDPTRDLVHFIPKEAWVEFLTYWAGEYNRAASNPADVLTPKPSPFAGQHYATYPPDLIRDLIRASTPARCCPECGAGWAAVVERDAYTNRPNCRPNGTRGNQPSLTASLGQPQQGSRYVDTTILGYRPTCACGHDDWTPGLVLDPFVGSGTTLAVAREEGFDAIGLDLSFDYLMNQARARLGLAALAAGYNGGKDGTGASLAGLPLFAEVR